jgi:hypothetical protein
MVAMDVSLVCMPFVEVQRPSLALGLLQAALARTSIRSEVVYANFGFAETIGLVAERRGMDVGDVMVVVLDRPRHEAGIKEIRDAGARVRLITDGDVAGAIVAASPRTEVDLLLGIGGTPEGVIAASALKCLGGSMQGKLYPRDDGERTALAFRQRRIGRRRHFARPFRRLEDEGVERTGLAHRGDVRLGEFCCRNLPLAQGGERLRKGARSELAHSACVSSQAKGLLPPPP